MIFFIIIFILLIKQYSRRFQLSGVATIISGHNLRKIFWWIIIVILVVNFIISPIFLSYFENISFFYSLSWIIKTSLSVDLPNLPTITSHLSLVLLFISGITGPIFLAMFLGIVTDYVLEKTYLATVGELTDFSNSNIAGHIIFVGFTITTLEAIQELVSMNKVNDKNRKLILIAERDVIERYVGELNRYNIERIAGNPLLEETLIRAKPETAKGIIISMGNDVVAFNTLLTLVGLLRSKYEEIKLKGKDYEIPLIIVEILDDKHLTLFEGFKKIIRERHDAIDTRIRKEKDIDDIISKRIAENIVIVQSRSLGGRLLASSLVEPLVVDIITDMLSFKDKFLFLDRKKISDIGFEEVKLKDLRAKIKAMYMKGIIPLMIETNNDNERIELIQFDKEWNYGDNETIYFIGIESNDTLDGRCRDLQYIRDSQALNEIKSFHETGERGHILILGYSEATQAFLREMKNLRRQLPRIYRKWYPFYELFDSGNVVVEELGEIIANKTMIVVAEDDEKIESIESDSIIVLFSQPDDIETLHRVGLCSSDAIVISTVKEEKAVKSLINVQMKIAESCDKNMNGMIGKKKRVRPIVIEVSREATGRRILNDKLAHVVVVSRSIAGRLMVHAILNSRSYFEVLNDLISVKGKIDIQQRTITTQLLRILRSEENGMFSKMHLERKLASIKLLDLAELFYKKYRMLPIAIYQKNSSNGAKLCLIPHPEFEIKEGDEIVLIEFQD